MNKVKTSDALEYAKLVHADYVAKAKVTLRTHEELLEKSRNSIWCRWFGFAPKGLSIWDYGCVDIRNEEYWSEHVQMLEYHVKLGDEYVVPPFKHLKSFYTWASENGKP